MTLNGLPTGLLLAGASLSSSALATQAVDVGKVDTFVRSAPQAAQLSSPSRIAASGVAEPGGTIDLKLSGFAPDATARIYFSNALSEQGGILDASGVLVGAHLLFYSEVLADQDGQVATTFTVPEDTPLGAVIYAQAFSSVGGPSQQVSVNAAQFDIGVTEAIDDSLSNLSGKCEINDDSEPWNASGIFTGTTDVVSNSFIEGSLALLVTDPGAEAQANFSRFAIHATGDNQEVLQTAPLIQFTSEFALDFDQTDDDDLPPVSTSGLATVDYASNTLTLQLNALPAHTTSPFSGESLLITVDILPEDRRRFGAFSNDSVLPVSRCESSRNPAYGWSSSVH